MILNSNIQILPLQMFWNILSLSFYIAIPTAKATYIRKLDPGWVAQLVRALSQYAMVVGLIPSEGPYRNQPVNA